MEIVEEGIDRLQGVVDLQSRRPQRNVESHPERRPVEVLVLVRAARSVRRMRRVEWASGRVSPTGCTGGVGGRVNGRGVYVAGYADGQLQNPGRTHPAYRRFRPDGQVKYDLFYTRGQLQDPGPRSAAVRGFYANLSLIHI